MSGEFIKTPLSYQITEFDCGQTTFLNAIRYLFYREEISPKIVKNIMHFTLDLTDTMEEDYQGGTSIYAIEYLSGWLNQVSKINKKMKMRTKILKGTEVNTKNPILLDCMNSGGVAIFRVWQEEEHYVLCTDIDEKYVYLFDPYYLKINYYENDEKCEIIKNRPFDFNRKIAKSRLDEFSQRDFSFVDGDNREILIINKM